MRQALLFLLLVVLTGGELRAQISYGRAPKVAKDPEQPPGVGITQKLGGKVPLDLEFRDHHNRPIKLSECVGDKPTVLVLAYFSCPKLCTEVLNGLVGEMKPLTRFDMRAGKDFNVITVSINPKDDPQFARKKRTSYLDEYDKRAEEDPGWWFLTASHGQGTDLLEAEGKIRTLAESIGYGYAADNWKAYDAARSETDPAKRAVLLETAIRKTKDYVHPSVVVILTKDGTISQYFHGLPRAVGGGDLDDGYNAEDLRTSLGTANGGKIGSTLNRLAMSCFAYDDQSATYKLNMSRLRWAAAPFLLMPLGFGFYAWRQARRERAKRLSVASDGLEETDNAVR